MTSKGGITTSDQQFPKKLPSKNEGKFRESIKKKKKERKKSW